jgi:hypothetical protein
MQLFESHEVSEMHANRLDKSWGSAHVPGEEAPDDIFSVSLTDPKMLAFREDLLHTVKTNVDHGRGTAIVLAERILSKVRKRYGATSFGWVPLDPENIAPWEYAAQVMLSDVGQGDYDGAMNAYDYLVATAEDYAQVAQLLCSFTTANYFLRKPENSSETA